MLPRSRAPVLGQVTIPYPGLASVRTTGSDTSVLVLRNLMPPSAPPSARARHPRPEQSFRAQRNGTPHLVSYLHGTVQDLLVPSEGP